MESEPSITRRHPANGSGSPRDHGRTVSRPELLEGGSDARFRHLVHDLLAFSARLESIRAQFGAYLGMTGVQYTILISVRYLQGSEGVGVKQVAEHLGLSGAFVTIETGKLIRAGMLEKRRNLKDRRRVLLTVSARAHAMLEDLAPLQRQINDAIFQSLDAGRFDALAREAAALRVNSDKAIKLANYLLGTAATSEGT